MQYVSLIWEKESSDNIQSFNKTVHSGVELFQICNDSPLTWAPLLSLSQYNCLLIPCCALSLRAQFNIKWHEEVSTLGWLPATFLYYWVDSVCPQQAALEGLSLFSLLLWTSCSNGLMTFCSNKFSGSDVSSILLQSKPVLIRSKCSFFFSLSRDFCSSERKLLLSRLVCATLATRLTSRQAVNSKMGKRGCIASIYLCNMVPRWNNTDDTHWWIAEKYCIYLQKPNISCCSCLSSFLFWVWSH